MSYANFPPLTKEQIRQVEDFIIDECGLRFHSASVGTARTIISFLASRRMLRSLIPSQWENRQNRNPTFKKIFGLFAGVMICAMLVIEGMALYSDCFKDASAFRAALTSWACHKERK